MSDADFLKLAVEESLKSIGPHKYGALIVQGGKIIAIDHNHVREFSDPSAHAEVSVLRQACQKLKVFNLPEGCTLYASHEPCIMCLCCAAWAEIDRIVFATPASEQDTSSYEFKGVNIFEMNQKLLSPMKIEMVRIDG